MQKIKKYIINGHLQGKKSAVYPDDFPLLKNDSKFSAWIDGDIMYIQTTLHDDEQIKQHIKNYLKNLQGV